MFYFLKTYTLKMKNYINRAFPSEYFNRPKVVMYDGYIEIYNYQRILDLEPNEIVVERYIVEGDNIKVSSMNKNVIKISGYIHSVRRRYNE